MGFHDAIFMINRISCPKYPLRNNMQHSAVYPIFFFQLGLLDFGATREYRKEFVDEYFNLLDAAARNDKETMLSSSVNLGFLTGYESKVMNDAHVESIMILATPFRENRVFDYGNQEVTSRTHELIQVII